MVYKRVRVGPLGGVPLILNLVEFGPLGPILYRFRALKAQTCKIWLFKVNDSINFFYELKITSPLEPTVFGQEYNLFIYCFSLKQYYNHYNSFGWVTTTYWSNCLSKSQWVLHPQDWLTSAYVRTGFSSFFYGFQQLVRRQSRCYIHSLFFHVNFNVVNTPWRKK